MNAFTPHVTRTLAAAADALIPADEDPGGWSGGTRTLLEENIPGFMAWAVAPLQEVAATIDQLATDLAGVAFADLAVGHQQAVLHRLLTDHPDTFDVLFRVATEGYYGGTRQPAGWQVAGFAAALPVLPPTTQEPVRPVGSSVAALERHYDVVVIGAGGGGGVVAAELSEAGRQVLLVERSHPLPDAALRGNHLNGKRTESYQPTAGPGPGNPREVDHGSGRIQVVPAEGDGGSWALNAMTLGGGTRLWQGMAWRFLPEDFAMASTYGVPEDSTLADWPFGYDELAPYYDRVENELGVAGDADGPPGRRAPRSGPYPMPPLEHDVSGRAFADAAARLGWDTGPIPFAINSLPAAGRPACVRCAQCVGHTCPVDAKNGTHNTYIPRALATGSCTLVTSTTATRIDHRGGTATTVQLVQERPGGAAEQISVGAGRVVVCAGAIETARLLLASGLGNEWVGRNHHTHGVALAIATDGPDVNPYSGPGHSVTTLDFLHRQNTPWGGGVLFDLAPAYPLDKARWSRRLAPSPYGPLHKKWMREHPNFAGAMAMVQEVPHADSHVRLSPHLTDRLGRPVARLRGRPHPATAAATGAMLGHARRWVEEVGGRGIVDIAIAGGVPGAEHSAGTVRLGDDPGSSACDPIGRLHGSTNVYVADASLHPTNGGMNPGLTAMANALRVACLLVAAT